MTLRSMVIAIAHCVRPMLGHTDVSEDKHVKPTTQVHTSSAYREGEGLEELDGNARDTPLLQMLDTVSDQLKSF